MTASQVSVGAWLAFAELAAPVLLSMLLVGLLAGMLQTMTQIRESSIAFILKLACAAVLTTLGGPLMMGGVEHYAENIFNALPAMIHG